MGTTQGFPENFKNVWLIYEQLGMVVQRSLVQVPVESSFLCHFLKIIYEHDRDFKICSQQMDESRQHLVQIQVRRVPGPLRAPEMF
jgi:hypothetical protein